MASEEDRRELGNGLILAAVLMFVLIAAWMCWKACRPIGFSEPDVAPPDGEHSIVVKVED